VFGLAFIIGPILGGILLKLFGWQSLFLVNLPIAAVVITLGLRVLPSSRPEERKAFDWPGMLVLGVLLASLAFGINQIDTSNFLASLASLSVWPFLLLTGVLLFVFARIERAAQDPVLRMTLFGSRQVALTAALAAGAGLGESGMVFMPQLAVTGLGMGKAQSSYMLMPVVLAMAFGSPTVGRLLDKFGSKIIVSVGTALLTAGMILLGGFATSTVMFIIAGAVIGLGLSALLGAPMRYIMLSEAPASDRAAAQGALTLFTSVGQLMSSAVVGAVAASQGGGAAGYSAAFLVIGGVSLVLTLLAFGLKGRAEEQATVQRNEQAQAALAAR
jgi:MFS family permease